MDRTVPPGYPREYERDLRLPDGRTVRLRPIVPEDAAQLAEAIRRADPDTLYRRFVGSPPPLTAALLTRLCTVDYRGRFALVALDPASGQGVAIARYEATTAGAAEVAVAVDPGWRGAGLATALIELLAEAALDRGITTFSAYYLAGNRPVAALVDRLGGGRQLIKEGLAEAAVGLDRLRVEAALHELGA
ncbi:GNAT family N-acetyltransferase [Actinoplanes sp. LDG1-06]|uniref:GNAT family N-acetyltransferase n=1 Tax=Paractinoplanes ovalisporus TaxID=2810368 RepID=A0ABS2AAV8_9ACTN|nr:GNAT family protein [Actinoplanes ovalisporus]MBM2616401.1 GNAT family N-acetyltransferase [Actinoplanes ovalisporus]